MIHLPIAALVMLIASDVGFWLSGDPFWARASLWLAGIGAIGGTLSGVAGFLDLVLVARIRRLVTAWAHAVLAVTLLSLAAFNFLLRWNDPVAVIVPWGLAVSLLTGMVIVVTGFLGAQLVYEYGVGVDLDEVKSRQVPP